ncbi:MAG: hypothetical protein ABIR71_11385 [Chthoniobacterales bacterium]
MRTYSTERGRNTMDRIRAVLREMNAEEHRRLTVRQHDLARDATRSIYLLWCLVATSMLDAGVVLFLLYRFSKIQPLAPDVRLVAHDRIRRPMDFLRRISPSAV